MYEDGGPPTLFQPASQQRGGEEVKTWQEEPGGGWRCGGISGENFFGVAFIQGVHSLLLVSCGLAGLADVPGFSRVD